MAYADEASGPEVSVDAPAVAAGETATATATVNGLPEGEDVTYSWYFSADKGASWSKEAETTVSTLSVTMSEEISSYRWVVRVSTDSVSAESEFSFSLSHLDETFSVDYEDAANGISGTISYKIKTDSSNGAPGEVLLTNGKNYAAKEDSPALVLDEVTNEETGYSYKITGVNRSAFRGNTALYHVVFSNSLTTYSEAVVSVDEETPCALAAYTFYRCTNLISVEFLGSELRGIGDYAFAHCTSLTDVEFAPELQITKKGIQYCAFFDCSSIKHITIPVITAAKRKGDYFGTYGVSGSIFLSGYEAYWHNTAFCISSAGIGDLAFKLCSSLESITFKAGNSVGMFAYWSSAGCGLRHDLNLTTVIFEDTQPYFGNPDASMGNSTYFEIWGQEYDYDAEEYIEGVNPTYYYSVSYYYTAAQAGSDDAAGDGRLARVEYADGTSISAIQAGDTDILTSSTADRDLYARTDADGVIYDKDASEEERNIAVTDPNVAARRAQSENVKGFEDADQYEWVWYLQSSQSRRRGLTDSCKAYLVKADSLLAGRLEANPDTEDQIEAFYRVCRQNLSKNGVQNTAFNETYFYDLVYNPLLGEGSDDAFHIKLGDLRHMDSGKTPWFTLGNGGLLDLPEQMELYDGAGNKLDLTDGDKFEITYQRYDSAAGTLMDMDVSSSNVPYGPVLMTITPKEGSGYDTSTCLKEWVLVYAHEGSVIEFYEDGTSSSDYDATWYDAIYSNKRTSLAREKFDSDNGFAVCVSSGDLTSALLATSYAGLSSAPINVVSSDEGYGFGIAKPGSFYSNGVIYDLSNVTTFKAGTYSPSEFANAAYRSFASRKSDMGLGAYNWCSAAVLVNPSYLEDSSAAAASYAYNDAAPIFYTESDGSLSDTTLSYLRDFDKVVVIGDEKMVPESTLSTMKQVLSSGTTVDRISGTASKDSADVSTSGNGSAISLAMADYLVNENGGVSRGSVSIVVASGDDCVSDVVGCQNFSGHEDSITLFVSTSADAKSVAQYLVTHKDENPVIRLFGRDGSAANAGTFVLYDVLGNMWKDGTTEVASLDTNDAIELYGVRFSADSERNLSNPVRVWGAQAISAGTYIGRATDGSAVTYTLSNAVPQDTADKPTAATGLTYTGSAQAGVPSSKAYTVQDGVKTDAGSYVAKVSLKSGYTWSDKTTDDLEISWEIAPASLDEAKVTLSASTETYTGADLTPTVSSVSLKSGTVISEDNYEVTIYQGTQESGEIVESVVDAGTYTVVVSGVNNCTGSTSATFKVAPILVARPEAKAGLSYTGEEQTAVAASEGYDVTGGSATDAGDYEAVVTLHAGHAWKTDGSTDDLTLPWSISQASLSGATVVLSQSSCAYSGEDVRPTVESVALSAELGGKVLASDDYTVTFELNGAEVDEVSEVGTYDVVVTGTGNCKDSVRVSFSVLANKTEKPTALTGFVYDGTAHTGVAESDRYTVENGTETDAGDYHAVVKLNKGYCWDDDSDDDLTLDWSISPATVSAMTLAHVSDAYTGSALVPGIKSVTATSGSVSLELTSEDYDVSYYHVTTDGQSIYREPVSEMIGVGNYYVVVTGTGNFEGSVEASFEILALNVSKPEPKAGLVYNGQAQTGIAEMKGYTVIGRTSAVGVGTYDVLVTLDAGYQWSDGSNGILSLQWQIMPASLKGATVTLDTDSRTYTGEALAFTVASVDASGVLADASDYTITYYRDSVSEENEIAAEDIVDVGTYMMELTGKVNFTNSAYTSFTVTPALVDVPTPGDGLVYDGTEQTGVSAGMGYSVEGGTATDAGEYTASVTPLKGYAWSDGGTDTREVNWSIAAVSLSNGDVALESSSETYTRSVHDPAVSTVTSVSGLNLNKGDYTVSYYRDSVSKDNAVTEIVDAGHYVVAVTGQGNYKDVAYADFEVTPASIDGGYLQISDGVVYSGSGQTPEIFSVQCADGLGLNADDYDVTYYCASVSDANKVDVMVDAATYVVVVTGKGNFTGANQAKWVISTASLDDATVTLSATEGQFSGDNLTPSVNAVALSGGGYANTSDYQVEYYRNGTLVDQMVEVGDYQVKLVAQGGNCTGSLTVGFSVLAKGKVPLPVAVSGLTYDGTEKIGVTEGQGYSVSGNKEANAGSYTAHVTLNDGYTWSDGGQDEKDVDWSIGAATLDGATLTLSAGVTYNGSAQTPHVESVVCASGLIANEGDYDLAYYRGSVADENKIDASQMVDAGDYVVVATGHDNFTGSVQQTWTIARASLDAADVDIANTTQTFANAPLSFEVKSVTLGETVLAANGDYSVTYYSGSVSDDTKIDAGSIIKVGDYFCVVEGQGNYSGSVTVSLRVNLRPVSYPVAIDGLVYNGESQTGVSEGEGYTLTGNQAKDAKTYTANATLKEGYCWTNGETVSYAVDWSIAQAPIGGGSLTLSSDSSVYQGISQSPTVLSVTSDAGMTLSSSDYQVAYYKGAVSESSKVTQMTNVGDYYVEVTGQGNFSGTINAKWSITPASLEGATVTLARADFPYSGNAQTPTISSVSLGDGGVALSADYEVTYYLDGKIVLMPTDMGTYTVRLTGKGNCTGVCETTYIIMPKGRASLPEVKSGLTYTGEELEGVAAATGYTVTGGKATNAGSYVATAKLEAGYHWVDGTTDDKEISWTIAQAPLSMASVSVSPENVTYNAETQWPDLVTVTWSGETVSSDEYDIAYYRGSVTAANKVDEMKDAGSYIVVVTGKSNGNFTGSTQVGWSIGKASLQDATVTLASTQRNYTGEALDFSVTSVVTADGLNVEAEGYDIVYYHDEVAAGNEVDADKITEVGDYTVVLTGKGNFADIAQVQFTVSSNYASEPEVTKNFTYDKQSHVGVAAVGSGYTVKNGSATNAGTYTATLTLDKGWCWSDGTFDERTIEWAIDQAPIDGGSLTLDGESHAYQGSAQAPKVASITSESGLELATSDYDVTYYLGSVTEANKVDEMVDAGDYVVVATAKENGNYVGSLQANWSITVATLDGATVKLKNEQVDWTGDAQTPEISSVTLNSGGVALSTDYEVTYYQGSQRVAGTPTSPGTYTVVLSGTGTNCTGEATATFTILPKNTLSTPQPAALTYNGTKQAGIPENDGYTIMNGEAVNAGEYEATVTLQPGFVWADGTQAPKVITWSITKRSISDAEVDVSSSSALYDGTAQAPEISSVKVSMKVDDETLQEKALTEGTDYTVEYYRGSVAVANRCTEMRDAGDYVIVLRGAGNYGETKEISWTINQATIAAATVTLSADGFDYTGSPIEAPEVSVALGSKDLVSGVDYSIKYYKGSVSAGNEVSSDQITDAGSYLVVIQGKGNYKGEPSSRPVFTVNYRTAANPEAVTSLIYNGAEQEGVSEGEGYTVASGKGTDAGSYTATATLKDGYQWSDGSTAQKKIDWSIAQMPIAGAAVTLAKSSVTYTGMDLKPAISSVTMGDASVPAGQYNVKYYIGSVDPENEVTSVADVGTYLVVVIAHTDGNYSGSAQATFTVNPIVVSMPSAPEGLTYNATAQVGIAATDAYVVDGGSATDAGTHTATLSLNKGYAWSDGTSAAQTVEWSIAPATIDSVVLAADSANWTGYVITPQATVKAGSLVLDSGDYSVAAYKGSSVEEGQYTSRIKDDGIYTVAYTGTENYTGTVTAQFTVKALLVSEPTAVTGLTYNKKMQTGVAKTTGIEVEGGTSSNAGAFVAKVTPATGYCWYDGTKTTRNIAWSIASAPATVSTVTLSKTSATYTGGSITPKVSSVVLSDGTKVASSGYSVTYYKGSISSDNKVDAPVEAGDYVVVVTLKGNYSGTGSTSFTIKTSGSGSESSDDEDGSSSSGSSGSTYYSGSSATTSTGTGKTTASTSSLGSVASSIASATSTQNVEKYWTDADGWRVFDAPGNSENNEVISDITSEEPSSPWSIVLVLVCLAAVGGSIVFAARSPKETDDQIDTDDAKDAVDAE